MLSFTTFIKAQTVLSLKSFKTGIYNQQSTGKGLDYNEFSKNSKSTSFLPTSTNYSNTLSSITLKNTGFFFGFEFQIGQADLLESNKHSFSIDIRNNLSSSNRLDNVFILKQNVTDTSQQANYNLALKNEIFGVGIGYHFNWINKNRFNGAVGLGFRYDIPVSRNLISTSGDGVIENQGFKYFLMLNSGWLFSPSISFDYRVTKYASLAFDYAFGMQTQKIDNTRFTSSSSVAQIGLKFNI